MKLTEPQPATDYPTIPGVYLTRRLPYGQIFWRAFDGKNWYFGGNERNSPSYERALKEGPLPEDMLTFDWQGLVENPADCS